MAKLMIKEATTPLRQEGSNLLGRERVRAPQRQGSVQVKDERAPRVRELQRQGLLSESCVRARLSQRFRAVEGRQARDQSAGGTRAQCPTMC
eukprot:4506491-Pleurochrysis_carterae.AAC.12